MKINLNEERKHTKNAKNNAKTFLKPIKPLFNNFTKYAKTLVLGWELNPRPLLCKANTQPLKPTSHEIYNQ